MFGQSNTEKMRKEMLADKWANRGGASIEVEAQQRRNNRSGKSKKGNKETVQVITKDLIRNLM